MKKPNQVDSCKESKVCIRCKKCKPSVCAHCLMDVSLSVPMLMAGTVGAAIPRAYLLGKAQQRLDDKRRFRGKPPL
jgi:hypothetical protein